MRDPDWRDREERPHWYAERCELEAACATSDAERGMFELWAQQWRRRAEEKAMNDQAFRKTLVVDWVRRCFGSEADRKERARRLLEEAIEYAQSEGVALEFVETLARHVYVSPPGEPGQELGGVATTLLAACHAAGLDPDEVEQAELRRILSKEPNHFRQRQNRKAALGLGLRSRDDE